MYTYVNLRIELCFVLVTVTMNNILNGVYNEMTENDIHTKHINFSSWFGSAKFYYGWTFLLNRQWRSSDLQSHSMLKWNSSYIRLHMKHSLSWAGVFGFLYLPRSIFNECKLAWNLAMAARYLKFWTLYKYGSCIIYITYMYVSQLARNS